MSDKSSTRSTKFKKGDKVEILNKTAGIVHLSRWNKGDIGYVVDPCYRFSRGVCVTVGKGKSAITGDFFRESDLKLIRDWDKFKVGDKVKAINKSIEDFGRNSEWKEGDIGYVSNTNCTLTFETRCIRVSKCKGIDKNTGYFNPEDLELIEREEEKMKHTKYTKGENKLTMSDIVKSGEPTKIEIDHFVKNMTARGYLYYDTIEIDDWFIEYVLSKNKCFMNWLIRNNFVKEVREFKPFDITLRINSLLELHDLFHRLNQSSPAFYNNYNMRIKNLSLEELKRGEGSALMLWKQLRLQMINKGYDWRS